MSQAYESVLDLVGDTPLVRLQNSYISKGVTLAPGAKVYGKMENRNPGGSVKDRIAQSMIEDAEVKGLIKPGDTLIEPTSGNTGIGLAWIGRLKGYKVILCMPESMSVERRKLLRSYGAELVLTDSQAGMAGAIDKAQKLLKSIPGSVMPSQFDNPANPDVHYRTTGPEIWQALDGKVDILVAGVGTGGTISGTGKYLKEQNPAIQVIAVEPSTSAVLSGQPSGAHMIQGIGAGFIPGNYHGDVVDEVIQIESHEAIDFAKAVAREDGLLVGISAGANALAAGQVAARPENAGKTVVTILCDTGERYISTLLFYDD